MPGVVFDPGQRLPHAGDPLGADRELHVLGGGGAGQLAGEIPGVGAQRDLPPRRGRAVPDGGWQRGQRPAQQVHHVRPRVLVAGQQVGGQRDLGLCPGRHVRPARPLALVGVGDAAFLAAVDLHVGGIDVDGHRPSGQLRRPLGGQQARHPRGRGGQAVFRAPPVRPGEPAHDPGRGRGGQARYRHQLLARGIGPDPVQPDQEVLPGQLRGGHPGQHLPAGEPPRPLLDRPDPGSSSPIRPSLMYSSVTVSIPPLPVSDGSSAPIWILPRVFPCVVPDVFTISVTPLLGTTSASALNCPSKKPGTSGPAAACCRSIHGFRSEAGRSQRQGAVRGRAQSEVAPSRPTTCRRSPGSRVSPRPTSRCRRSSSVDEAGVRPLAGAERRLKDPRAAAVAGQLGVPDHRGQGIGAIPPAGPGPQAGPRAVPPLQRGDSGGRAAAVVGFGHPH